MVDGRDSRNEVEMTVAEGVIKEVAVDQFGDICCGLPRHADRRSVRVDADNLIAYASELQQEAPLAAPDVQSRTAASRSLPKQQLRVVVVVVVEGHELILRLTTSGSPDRQLGLLASRRASSSSPSRKVWLSQPPWETAVTGRWAH